MYALNEKVVYPGHGVAQINQIIEKSIGTTKTKFYELKFLNKDMTILIPVQSEDCGIRPLSSKESVDQAFAILSEPVVKKNCIMSSWNKRNKKYQYKLKTGNFVEIIEIYRDLQSMAREKDLSFGERNLLNQTEALLAEEISLVKNLVAEQAIETLRSVFFSSLPSTQASHTSSAMQI